MDEIKQLYNLVEHCRHKRRNDVEPLLKAISALEKQIEMKKYCDENDCVDCPYHNISLKDNRCMNDFIIDKE